MSARSLTMFEKIWSLHVMLEEEGETLLYIDRALIHDGSNHEFTNLEKHGRTVSRPAQVLAYSDHYAQTTGRERGIDAIAVVEIRDMAKKVIANTARHGIPHVGL